MLSTLMSVYGEICMSRNDEFRIAHQKLACELRDAIAELLGQEPETVQNFCEACARVAEGK